MTNGATEATPFTCQVCGKPAEVALLDYSDMTFQHFCTQDLFKQVVDTLGQLPDEALASVTGELLGSTE